MNSADINIADVLEREISVLKRRADAERGGMGCYYTAISILKLRLQELREEK